MNYNCHIYSQKYNPIKTERKIQVKKRDIYHQI